MSSITITPIGYIVMLPANQESDHKNAYSIKSTSANIRAEKVKLFILMLCYNGKGKVLELAFMSEPTAESCVVALVLSLYGRIPI